eukprot:2692165-Pyramimonas_sp.AAC.1
MDIEDFDSTPDTKHNNEARVIRYQDFWRRFRSRTYVTCMYDPAGAPCDSLEGSAQVLRECWSQVFSPKELDRSMWPEVSEYIHKIPEQLPVEC